MSPFPKNCERCGADLSKTSHIMSMFNRDVICSDCKDKETKHPQYRNAVNREIEACQRGDYNFPGIGKPADL